ncbi:MAG TPA: O-methyltransferase [Kouleothrix sp.]|uniref:O-methyltransferase n=1 Tax=Kouleothrix sp. TaxID=2779161 RepID=UPI002B746251|nr:O-methyltransferase [Kouleothrix sp.]HRC74091.1 O-methyltransferase [Kouleothrix sp.]
MRDDITNIVIEDYLSSIMPPRAGVLAELEQRARERGLPLVGPVEGQLLYLLAKSMGAREALEIGTATGYAAMWLMRAVVPAGGRLTAIERQPERYKLAQDYITRAGYGDRLNIIAGEWFSVLETIQGPFDLIFLDILRNLSNEHDAVKALELCVSRLRPGGLLIGDNVLCNGLVVEEDAAPTVRGIQEFNRAIMQHSQLESVIIPLRDGVAICRKKD